MRSSGVAELFGRLRLTVTRHRRGAYTAVAVAKLLNLITPELTRNTAEWISSCQTYEGGLGGEPGHEAHGGYAFCGVAALVILGAQGTLNEPALLRWVASCQKRLEGGFHGRTNKLVDGCYSFWQGATVSLIARLGESGAALQGLVDADGPWLFDQTALEDYLLLCSQLDAGLCDKPGKVADYYHTCYCLSGLSIAQERADGPPRPAQYGSSTQVVRARARLPCRASAARFSPAVQRRLASILNSTWSLPRWTTRSAILRTTRRSAKIALPHGAAPVAAASRTAPLLRSSTMSTPTKHIGGGARCHVFERLGGLSRTTGRGKCGPGAHTCTLITTSAWAK